VRILAVDAATAVLTVALDSPDGPGAELNLRGPGAHAENLMRAIRTLLDSTGVGPRRIDAVVAGVGPGSFTGIRIAVAAAKGLAYALSIPAVGVSTLDIMAAAVWVPGLVVSPVLDARRGEVYGAVYQNTPLAEGPLTGYLNLPMAKFLLHLRELGVAGRPVCFLGDAALKHASLLRRELGPEVWVAPREAAYPRALVAAALGRERLRAGEGGDPAELVPLYLKRSEAERLCES